MWKKRSCKFILYDFLKLQNFSKRTENRNNVGWLIIPASSLASSLAAPLIENLMASSSSFAVISTLSRRVSKCIPGFLAVGFYGQLMRTPLAWWYVHCTSGSQRYRQMKISSTQVYLMRDHGIVFCSQLFILWPLKHSPFRDFSRFFVAYEYHFIIGILRVLVFPFYLKKSVVLFATLFIGIMSVFSNFYSLTRNSVHRGNT